jgi:thiol:disulfide interchange protein DsbC
MIDNKPPPQLVGPCDDAAIQRNTAFGREHRLSATPAIVFEDGHRVPGAMPAEALEGLIAAASHKP